MEIAARDRRSSSGKTIGLSVTAPASIVSVRAALSAGRARAHHLRLAAEAVGVLDLAAARVAGDDLAALSRPAMPAARGPARLAAKLADARIERPREPLSASTESAPPRSRRRTRARQRIMRRALARSTSACR
jgi:hypothetical protein